MGVSDYLLANSQFTAEVTRKTFPHLTRQTITVVYSGVEAAAAPQRSQDEGAIILSLNRFDPRKNLVLALKAFAGLQNIISMQLKKKTICSKGRGVLSTQAPMNILV